MRYERVKPLFCDSFEKLTNSSVLLLGVGGVGGFCLDLLYRSGVTDITVVDFDTFEITNQNRQIGSEYIGEKKVYTLKKIYKRITPLDQKVTPEWIEKFNFDSFDIVIDAIDDIKAKTALAHKTYKKLISSCGAAKRLDPSLIEINSVYKTKNDPFAKKFRYELRKSGFCGDFEVVYSKELPKNIKEMGSFVGVTGTMGLMLGTLAIRKLTSS